MSIAGLAGKTIVSFAIASFALRATSALNVLTIFSNTALRSLMEFSNNLAFADKNSIVAELLEIASLIFTTYPLLSAAALFAASNVPNLEMAMVCAGPSNPSALFTGALSGGDTVLLRAGIIVNGLSDGCTKFDNCVCMFANSAASSAFCDSNRCAEPSK